MKSSLYIEFVPKKTLNKLKKKTIPNNFKSNFSCSNKNMQHN